MPSSEVSILFPQHLLIPNLSENAFQQSKIDFQEHFHKGTTITKLFKGKTAYNLIKFVTDSGHQHMIHS